MKQIGQLLLFILVINCISCKDEDPIPTDQFNNSMNNGNGNSNNQNQGTYNFLDRNLEGGIDNRKWTFKMGHCKPDSSGKNFVFFLFDSLTSDSCMFLKPRDRVEFNIPPKTGLYQFSQQSPALLFQARNRKNVEAYGGAVEILVFDSIQHVVKGRIDTRVDDQNQVNGNFTIKLCK